MTDPALSETIAVCLQLAHTTDVRIRLREDGRAFRAEEAAGAINPADLSALALGLSLAAEGGGLAAVTVGPEDWEAPLREALAAGAVQAVRVWNGAWPAEVWAGAIDGSAGHTAFCARMAAAAIEPLAPRLVLTGESGAVAGHGCFGAFLAHALGAAYAHRAVLLEREGGGWRVRVKLERGYTQEMTLPAPAVVTVSAALPVPPPATLPAWLDSLEAKIPVIQPAEAYPAGPHTTLRAPVPRVKRFELPGGTLDAEGRIRAMVDLPTGSGGTVIPREAGAEAQAEAIAALLEERGYLGKPDR